MDKLVLFSLTMEEHLACFLLRKEKVIETSLHDPTCDNHLSILVGNVIEHGRNLNVFLVRVVGFPHAIE